MSGVSVLQHFEAYQKARVTFVQAVAEAATRPQNIEVMQNAGVMQLLRPLLLDNVRAVFDYDFTARCRMLQSNTETAHGCSPRGTHKRLALMPRPVVCCVDFCRTTYYHSIHFMLPVVNIWSLLSTIAVNNTISWGHLWTVA